MVFGLDDAALAALATVTAASIKGGVDAAGSSSQSSAQAKGSKRQAKESKRQTLADMYNKALQREFDLYRFNQEQSGTNTARRNAALQETANGFSRSLLGR